MAKNITMIYPLYALEINDRPDGEISHGYFIRNEGNKVSAVKAIVQMEGPKISPIFTPIVTFIKSNSLILSGHREILAEFAENGESDRAKAIGAETMGRVSGNPDPQIWAAKTEMYVKAVRDWSGDVGIGEILQQ